MDARGLSATSELRVSGDILSVQRNLSPNRSRCSWLLLMRDLQFIQLLILLHLRAVDPKRSLFTSLAPRKERDSLCLFRGEKKRRKAKCRISACSPYHLIEYPKEREAGRWFRSTNQQNKWRRAYTLSEERCCVASPGIATDRRRLDWSALDQAETSLFKSKEKKSEHERNPIPRRARCKLASRGGAHA